MQIATYQVRTPDGRTWGPLSDEQVRASIRAGGITRDCWIATAGTQDWTAAWKHPAFGAEVQAIPVPSGRGGGPPPRREMSAGKIIGIVLGITALALGLCAIPAVYLVNTGKSSFRALLRESEKPQVLAAEDRLAELTFPEGWREDSSLNDDANIQASGHFRSAFAINISEPKSDFPAGTSLQAYSDLTRRPLAESLEKGSVSRAQTMRVGTYPAIRYEVRGNSDGTDVVMLHHVVETRRHFHQLLLWTPAPEFAAKRTELERIAQTFRVPSAP